MRHGDGSSLRRSDLVGDRVWERTIECQLVFRTLGIDHTIYCFRAIPTAPDEVSGSMLSRAAGRRDFKVREKEIAREAHTVLGPLVGGPLARFAEPSPTGLPPRVGQVLRCLLEGDSDKQAAARLGISAHTVNEYVKTIFNHFGVQSRAELMARWVRRGWGTRFARWPEADPPRGG
jgi:DNA-binding NarL/FixJ family response regulator